MVEEISVSKCDNGNILATDVSNKKGAVIVAKHTIINDYIKDRLIDFGIDKVHIFNSNASTDYDKSSFKIFKRNYEEIIMETKSIIQDLVGHKPLDYERFNKISQRIYDNLQENKNVVNCLLRVQKIDEYTYTHCVNTAFYSMLIAKWLKLSDDEVTKAIQSGLLHDIGKTKIPTEILNKNGILTKEEYEVIKKHTSLGYEMVADLDINSSVKRAILLHHERFDGSGYPLNLSAESINLYARIVAVADVYDAMTSDRPYRKGVTPFEVFEMFQTVGMGMYDVKILKTFLTNIVPHLVGTRILMNTGETGEIAYIPLQNLTGPIVKISSKYLDLSKDSNIKIQSILKR